jgi:dihydrofolate reductase
MANIRLDMSMSIDGFVAGPKDDHDNPMGIGGFRLFNWLDHRHDLGSDHDAYADSLATEAIISGRRTFELAGRWNGDHHDGVPILVLTHHVEEGDEPPGAARFYTDVAACAAAARAGAGDKDVMVHGAEAGQALIRAGELDEIEVHVAPVLLGSGRRLFDLLDDLPEPVELELVRVLEGRDATHLRYRVVRPA